MEDAQALIKPLNLRSIPYGWWRNKEGYEVLLSTDPYHKERYLKRGFVFLYDEKDKPKTDPLLEVKKKLQAITTWTPKEEVSSDFTCKVCGVDMGNATALGCHMRKHNSTRRSKIK